MLREKLGEFCSIVCFKAAIVGMKEAVGEKATTMALIATGRSRGKNLAKELGLTRNSGDWNLIADQIGFALGVST